jgi:hypothetical protein
VNAKPISPAAAACRVYRPIAPQCDDSPMPTMPTPFDPASPIACAIAAVQTTMPRPCPPSMVAVQGPVAVIRSAGPGTMDPALMRAM